MSNEVECFLLRTLKKTRGKANKIVVIAPDCKLFYGICKTFSWAFCLSLNCDNLVNETHLLLHVLVTGGGHA